MSNKFLDSISGRWGFDTLYYHRDHIRDTGGDIKAGVDLPWYAWLSRFVTNSSYKCYWLRKILSFKSGWCRYDDNWGLEARHGAPNREWFYQHMFKRVFYVFKAIVCLFLLSRRGSPDNYLDFIDVAVFDIGPMGGEYSGDSWDAVAVGYGVFKNWYFREYSDSSC